MAIIRWDPFREMMELRQEMDKLFGDSFARTYVPWAGLSEGQIPLDMYQTENDVVVKAAMPGAKPEEVDISITGDTLTIKGEHKEEQETKDEAYFRRELRYGALSRTVQLPISVQSDKADATFENGILTLTLPKAEELKPKQIKVHPKVMIEGGKN